LPNKLNKQPQPCLNNSLLIGQVLPGKTPYEEASGFNPGALVKQQRVLDIRVPYYVYDEYFKSFFEHEWDFLAEDTNEICRTGDTILIRRIPDVPDTFESTFLQHLAERKFWEERDKPMPRAVTHQVMEVIYNLGEVVDPLTKKPVIGEKYVDQIQRDIQMYGKSKSDFSYSTAPPRGWQEGKRDFTGRKTYKKWHQFKKNDKYGTS